MMPRWLSPVERLPRKQQAAGAKPARGSFVSFVFLLCGKAEPIDNWKCLLNIAILDVNCVREANVIQLFRGHHDEKIMCPYKGCEKQFDKPTVITDASVIPRQTHYACPFCMSKIDIITEKQKIIGVKATEYPIVFDSPAKCAHFSGLLQAPGGSMFTQEECLICPKVLQCSIRKK